ncbi:MAG TPA: amidohydrolase family protein [Candidatus Dormibacteraeota bacterium]|nr:amidohydrolase family protein [Candidatus Dormibacteraeota bacterium]
MKRVTLFVLFAVITSRVCGPQRLGGQDKPIVIAANTVLDGRGRILHDTRIVVHKGKIVRIDPKAEPVAYDLRGLTVMPGWIDAHVHITSHFGADGRLAVDGLGAIDAETPATSAYGNEGNAWATLLGGFTTVQSIGSPADGPLRDAINRGIIPGPRLLTSLQTITFQVGGPAEMRAAVRKLKADGAEVVKVFASKSMREGGEPTLSREQLDALCDEGRKAGIRVLVHAYRDAIRRAVLAGCPQIEHGIYASDEDLRLMVEHHTRLDPQVGLVYYNYMNNKEHYLGIGNYTEAGFEAMKQIHQPIIDLFKRAIKTPGLKVVFGTDATAGADGHNAEELIYRVNDGGQSPMDALVSANSVTAESMGLGDQIGTIAPNYAADIIAIDGDPMKDITAVRRVTFVMKGGTVYKNVAR